MRNLLLFAVLFLLVPGNVFSQVTTDSLVGYWKFDGDAADLSGNSNNGNLINGASFTFDRFFAADKALQLVKDQQEYVSIPNNASLQVDNQLSISFWAKRTSYGNGVIDQVLNKGGDWPGGTCNYGLVFSDWTLCFIYNGGYSYVGTPGVPQDTSWHHYVVVTANGTEVVNFYIDNSLKTSMLGVSYNPTVNLFSSSIHDLYIGGVNYYSNNALDDIRIYKRLLDEAEISSLYYEEGFLHTGEMISAGELAVYPNPATSKLYLSVPGMLPVERASIINAKGESVKEIILNDNVLNVEKLPKGLYFIRIHSGIASYSTKFIKE